MQQSQESPKPAKTQDILHTKLPRCSVLQALVMMEPKATERMDDSAITGGDDRALALPTWFARAQEISNRGQVQDGTWDIEEDWVAAAAGNPCLREAMSTA